MKMRTIELTHTDLWRLHTLWPIYVDGSCVVIYGYKELGIAQPGWTLLQLNLEEVKTLYSGCSVVVRNFKLIPPMPKDAFIGYNGGRYVDTSYVSTPASQPLKVNRTLKVQWSKAAEEDIKPFSMDIRDILEGL